MTSLGTTRANAGNTPLVNGKQIWLGDRARDVDVSMAFTGNFRHAVPVTGVPVESTIVPVNWVVVAQAGAANNNNNTSSARRLIVCSPCQFAPPTGFWL